MNRNQNQTEAADPKAMIALEEELAALRQRYGKAEKQRWWMKTGDVLVTWLDREPVRIHRKTYLKLAVSCGWFCGAHRFYRGQRMTGLLYLLFCWTGIPFAMTLVDLMEMIPKRPDEGGIVEI